MLVIGVTGNIGSGKSTVAHILKNMGAYVINTDAVARETLKKGGLAYDETVAIFGDTVLDAEGEIDRKRLAALVFSDKTKLEQLNGSTHKHVYDIAEGEIADVRRNKSSEFSLICLEVPLLFEAGFDNLCDKTWVVDAEREVKLQRVIARDNTDYDQALKRLKSQTSADILREKADAVIFNNGDCNELKAAVVSALSGVLRKDHAER